MKPLSLERSLRDRRWVRDMDSPAWGTQGWRSTGSLLQRSSNSRSRFAHRHAQFATGDPAVRQAGGWAGMAIHAKHIAKKATFARGWTRFGFEMMVATDALAWHLYAPEGAARDVLKLEDRKVCSPISSPFARTKPSFGSA